MADNDNIDTLAKKMMKKQHQRVYFTQLRHKYYVAGRVLFLNNCMDMGALMLGYAIENHFKHALNEINFTDQKILHGHDLNVLLDKCKECGLFTNLDVSDDLIQYANDMFDQRYPSQKVAKMDEMLEGNRQPILTPSILIAYDDLLIQLDNSIWEMTGDHKASLGMIAALNATSLDNRIFFHCNAPAISTIPRYLAVMKTNYPTHVEEINLLEQGTNYLWKFDKISISFPTPYELLIKEKPAKIFQYPGKVFRDKNGKITRMLITFDFFKHPDD